MIERFNIKNIAISLLVIITFMQTGELWFGNQPNHNFFYSFFNSRTVYSSSEYLSDLSKPYRIIAAKDSDIFQIKYTGINESEQKKVMDEVIINLFKNGEFVSSRAMDWDISLSSIIYEYSFNMPSDAFTAAYNQKTSLLSSKFKEFNKIFLIAGNNISEPIRVVFYDRDTKKSYEYKTTQNKELNQKIINAKASLSVSNGLYYTASKLSPYTSFNDNVFIPRWDGDAFKYADIVLENQYLDNGLSLVSNIEKKIDVFFNNPSKIKYQQLKNVYTFSDENTVVKYYTSGIVEANNYRVVDEKITSTFVSAYNKAIEYISRDLAKDENNDYFLSEYYTDENDNLVFCFDYAANDFPIYMSQRINITPALRHAIEVTVSHDYVIKYMRYTYNYKVDMDSISLATKDFINILDHEKADSISTNDDSNDLIQDFSIGYTIENIENEDSVKIYWYITYSEGSTKILSAY